jgi:hypothetical protein
MGWEETFYRIEISFCLEKSISFFPLQFPFRPLPLAEISNHLMALSRLSIFSFPEIPFGLPTVHRAFPFYPARK